jgi:hypothetical protein
MDDIDKDIEGGRIGRRREEAHEQMNHPIIPKTNLKPLHIKPRPTPKACQYRYCKHKSDGKPLIVCEMCGKSFCYEHHFPQDHMCRGSLL